MRKVFMLNLLLSATFQRGCYCFLSSSSSSSSAIYSSILRKQQNHKIGRIKKIIIGAASSQYLKSSSSPSCLFFSTTSTSFQEQEDKNNNEEDLLRWERMYNGGRVANTMSSREEEESSTMEYIKKSQVRVVTFDLDNTLWNTTACINAANDALAIYLAKDNIQQPIRVEKIMGELFRSSKSRYAPLESESEAKSPVLLTQLRMDAVCYILEEHNGYSKTDAKEYAEKAFQIWTTARHEAIPFNLASHVIPSLEKIASITTTNGGHPVLIGAITDGNSDPRNVNILKDFFDFCINAEEVGIGKPDKRVYMKAIRYVTSQPQFQDLLLPLVSSLGKDDEEVDEELLESIVGPYWVHIGDDFVKDIVAAKDLNMRSIWATELIRDKLLENENSNTAVQQAQGKQLSKEEEGEEVNTTTTTGDNSSSSSSDGKKVGDFVKKVSEMKSSIIEMPIGAENYLADSIQKEFVDSVAEEFSSIASVLLEWHEEGLLASSETTQKSTTVTAATTTIDDDDDDDDTKTQQDISISTTLETPPPPPSPPTSIDNPLSVIMPEKKKSPAAAANDGDINTTGQVKAPPRVFRLVREDTSMDIPAPILDRDSMTMKPVLELAQMDKSSGVFSFPIEDVQALRDGKMVLMVNVTRANVQFSREIFLGMTVQEVLSLTDENPVTLSLSMKKASTTTGYDIF